jgi:glycosyltransferase involved in cell wall biosynthesis
LPASGPLILFVGFFSADKGPHILFEAWRRIAATAAAGSSLLFIGSTASSYYEVDERLAYDIREAAQRDGLAARVLFVEESRIVEEYYRAADIFVFPSRREGFGMALVEAMASGLPCIASRLPGATDEIVTDGVDGLLVEPHDVVALSAALERVLADRQLAVRLGHSARSSVEQRFAIEKTARRTLEAYQRVAEPA